MMRQHPVEDGPLRMSRTIDSRHSRRMASRNGPTHGDDRVSLERRDEARLERENQVRKRQPELPLSGGNGKLKGTDTARLYLGVAHFSGGKLSKPCQESDSFFRDLLREVEGGKVFRRAHTQRIE
jgi:hypothetical protein